MKIIDTDTDTAGVMDALWKNVGGDAYNKTTDALSEPTWDAIVLGLRSPIAQEVNEIS